MRALLIVAILYAISETDPKRRRVASRDYVRTTAQAWRASKRWRTVRDQIDACRRDVRRCDDAGQRTAGMNHSAIAF
ncbi:hypothetical protein ACFS32_09380 [Novosphingobium pokkalii]|uniref:hypothetical protein n=1 Tax=Novosphingobium pokkalii TaxID=1770194 RepID=UPI00362A86CE